MKVLFLLILCLLTSCTWTRVCPGTDLDYCPCPVWKSFLSCKEAFLLHPQWWEEYQDPCLNQLEMQAIAHNFDLHIAAARVLQARALVGVAISNRLPHLGLDFSYKRESAFVTLQDYGLGSKNVRTHEQQASLPLDICYEIDFWGKYRHLDAAARERFFASQYNRDALFISLTTEIALLYFNLRTMDDEISYLQEAVQVRVDYRAIHAARLHCGLESELDLTRAKLEVALAESELEDVMRLRSQAENALALLLGQSACDFSLEPGHLPCRSLYPSPGLPSSLVARRPDIQQKMHLALGALEDIGVAKADFFPQFSLTGSVGSVCPSFASLLSWQSRFWALAVNAFQVIFDGGRLKSQLALRKAEYMETILDYQKQITVAFKEVEDALSELHYRQQQVDTLEQAVLFSQDTSLLAHQQYDSGLINYLLVADAEKTQLNTRRMFIRLNGALHSASLQLIKALGGCPY